MSEAAKQAWMAVGMVVAVLGAIAAWAAVLVWACMALGLLGGIGWTAVTLLNAVWFTVYHAVKNPPEPGDMSW